VVPYSKDEKGWWEATPEEEEEPSPDLQLRSELEREFLSESEPKLDTIPTRSALALSSGGLLLGLISPWGFWYESGFWALRWSIPDLTFVFTEGLNNYSEWGFTPLSFIEWAMFPMLPLVFVTTFVATWYKSLQGDKDFGRKASIFHLSFFGIFICLNTIVWGFFPPSGHDYGIWIAAFSGIGLHPTAYGLVEKFSNSD
jgi:hypothetical protein